MQLRPYVSKMVTEEMLDEREAEWPKMYKHGFTGHYYSRLLDRIYSEETNASAHEQKEANHERQTRVESSDTELQLRRYTPAWVTKPFEQLREEQGRWDDARPLVNGPEAAIEPVRESAQ